MIVYTTAYETVYHIRSIEVLMNLYLVLLKQD